VRRPLLGSLDQSMVSHHLGLLARSSPSPAACRRLVPGPDHAPPTPARPPRQGGPVMPDGQLDPTGRATESGYVPSPKPKEPS
jgi:hypothetical protein